MKFSKLKQIAAVAALAGASTGAMACGPDSYMGMVCWTAASFCPKGTLPANGSLQPIQQYSALYSLLGTAYGGNGVSTFGLPDLRARTAVGSTDMGGQPIPFSNIARGQTGGAESVTLNISQMPAHNHQVPVAPGSLTGTVTGQTVGGTITVNALNSGAGTGSTPSTTLNTMAKNGLSNNFAAYSATTAVAVPTTSNLTVSGGTVAINGTNLTSGVTGQGTPVSVRDPYVGVIACVVSEGTYPSRP